MGKGNPQNTWRLNPHEHWCFHRIKCNSPTLEYSIVWEKNKALPSSVTLLVFATTNNNKTGTIQWFEEW